MEQPKGAHMHRINPLEALAGTLVLSGFAGVFVLAQVDATGTVQGAWWFLAWGLVLGGGLMFAIPPAYRKVRDAGEAKRARLAAEAAAQAVYQPPTASDPVYNEGQWWLTLDRGSDDKAHVQMQVFEPHGRDPLRSFAQFSSGPATLRYPKDFGIERPLPTGEHTVVWSLGDEANRREVRTSFVVTNDIGQLRDLVRELAEIKAKGEALLTELPAADFRAWNERATSWAQGLELYVSYSPHLGPVELASLSFWSDEPIEDRAEAARAAIQHRLGRLDEFTSRFGGGEPSP